MCKNVFDFLLPSSLSKSRLTEEEIEDTTIFRKADKYLETVTALRPKKNDSFAQNVSIYEGWNFNSGNYLFTTDTK